MKAELRVDKRRATAELTLVAGGTLTGSFFLAGDSQVHAGPERISDLLNAVGGFFPFESNGEITMINRAHVLKVALPSQMIEVELGAGYHVAPRHRVRLLLTTGETVVGQVVVFLPPGRDRLSDYAQIDERFRHVELADRSLLINAAHIVALTEVPAA